MHFTGRTWRPPYEKNSVILQVTSGCTYGKCRFCSLYAGEPFRMSPLEEIEEDLAEIRRYQPRARRVFWTGGNPFAMNYENLSIRARLVREYLPKCQTIAMFASIRDIQKKELWQLRQLRAMGINGLSIGTESGDEETLRLANKGYTPQDILEQCRRLDAADIEYYFVYMTGLAGKGNGRRNARRSAEVYSQLNPYLISVDSLTLFPDTALYQMANCGAFQPAGERERLQELQCFVRELQIKTRLLADTKSNYYPLTAVLPREKKRVVRELQDVLDSATEEEMQAYRDRLQSL